MKNELKNLEDELNGLERIHAGGGFSEPIYVSGNGFGRTSLAAIAAAIRAVQAAGGTLALDQRGRLEPGARGAFWTRFRPEAVQAIGVLNAAAIRARTNRLNAWNVARRLDAVLKCLELDAERFPEPANA